MQFDPDLIEMATLVIERFKAQDARIATAESCTGGLIAGLLTEIPGSSDAFERGFVTYSNEAKAELLNVDPQTLHESGAVSAETAYAMAIGGLAQSDASACVAVTGIAGPGGGTAKKPAGLVYIAVAANHEEGAFVEECQFGDIGRSEVRSKTINVALEMLLAYGLDEESEQ